MCLPIAAIGFTAAETAMVGVSAVAAAASYYTAEQTASANAKSQKASYEAQMGQLQLQRQQVNANASDQMSARAQQAQAAEARLRAASGESGLSGVSDARNQNEIKFNESQDIATIDANRKATIQQTGMNAMGIQANTQSAVNRVPQPSWIGAGLSVANTATGIYYRQPNNAGAGVQTGSP